MPHYPGRAHWKDLRTAGAIKQCAQGDYGRAEPTVERRGMHDGHKEEGGGAATTATRCDLSPNIRFGSLARGGRGGTETGQVRVSVKGSQS